MNSITFFVAGIPKPAGSKTAFAIKKGGVYTGRTVVMDACKKTKSWQATVKAEARKHAPETPFVCAIKVEFTFLIPRPKSHFGTGKNSKLLKPLAPSDPIGKPDVLKLARAVEDAMTGIIYADDSQIIIEDLQKGYDPDHVHCGVLIKVFIK
jgi:Holliday junction resolvase RusA-like endonuclease